MLELLKNRSVLLVKGENSLRFLNNIITNDLKSNVYCYSYMLSPQGRFLYDFFIYKRSEEEFWLDVESSLAVGLLGKLNLYNLRGEVQIEDVTASYNVLYTKEEPALLDRKLAKRFFCIHQDPRFHALGFRVIIEAAYAQELQFGTDSLYFKDKYDNAIPDGANDLIFQHSLITHFGAEELVAVSYSKGCYIGQEVVSRAKHQGTMRKKLFKIISGTEIAPMNIGDEITDLSGNKIGIFCSSHRNLGISLLEEEKYSKLDKKTAIINGKQEAAIEVPAWRG